MVCLDDPVTADTRSHHCQQTLSTPLSYIRGAVNRNISKGSGANLGVDKGGGQKLN